MQTLRYRWENEVRLQTDHLPKIDEMNNGEGTLKFTSRNHTKKEILLPFIHFEK